MDYFTLSDLTPLINLNGRIAKFQDRDDATGFCEQIQNLQTKLINALKERNFNVPGFDIEFFLNREKGTVEVFRISNTDLDFRMVGNTHFMIKEKEICMYGDCSGSLQVYVGGNWERDRKEFFNGKLFHRKMDGKSHIHLEYTLWGTMFKNSSGDSREYPRSVNDPEAYNASSIEKELGNYLMGIIGEVKKTPIPAPLDLFVEPIHIELKNELFAGKKLIGYGSKYNEDKEGIFPSQRLLSLSMKLPEHPFAKQMHDGFIYMEIIDKDAEATKPNDTYGYNYAFEYDRQLGYSIEPKNYNNFYVIDAATFDALKMEWFNDNPDFKNLTDNLVNEFKTEQAKTMVPINEYKGGYVKPVVITNRHIWPEEMKKVNIKKQEHKLV